MDIVEWRLLWTRLHLGSHYWPLWLGGLRELEYLGPQYSFAIYV